MWHQRAQSATPYLSRTHPQPYVWDPPTKPQVAVWALLLLITGVLILANYDAYQPGTHRDDSRYIILAQSLRYSDTYGMINTPGQPSLAPYPFGYPLLLAALSFLFPGNLDALKSLSFIATLLNAGLIFWGWPWLSRRSYWWGLAIIGLYLLSPTTVGLARRIMSESVYIAFYLGAVLLAEQVVRSAAPKPSAWWRWLMSLMLVFILFTRSVGVVVVVGLVVYLLWAKGRGFWKELALIGLQMVLLVSLVIALTPVGLRDLFPSRYVDEYKLYTSEASIAPPVVEETPQADKRPREIEAPFVRLLAGIMFAANVEVPQQAVLLNFAETAELHLEQDVRHALFQIGGGEREKEIFAQLGLPLLPYLWGLFFSLVIFIGFWSWFAQEGFTAFFLTALFYFAFLFVWLWRDVRFLNPIQPQLYLALLLGVETMGAKIAAWLARLKVRLPVRSGLLGLALVALFGAAIYKSNQFEDTRDHVGDLEARSRWLRTHTPSTAIIASEAPDVDYIYGGRQTVVYPSTPITKEALAEYLASREIDYVLVAPAVEWHFVYTPTYSAQMLELMPLFDELQKEQRLRLAYVSQDNLIQVFEVMP